MSRDGEHAVAHRAAGVSVLTLACTACQLVYEPDLAAFGTGTTGCPRCSGWTWIAQLDIAEWSTGTDHPAPQPHACDDIRPDPAVRRLDSSPPDRVSPTTTT
jgi:hypothetical protein